MYSNIHMPLGWSSDARSTQTDGGLGALLIGNGAHATAISDVLQLAGAHHEIRPITTSGRSYPTAMRIGASESMSPP